jgi:hypothetical protein
MSDEEKLKRRRERQVCIHRIKTKSIFFLLRRKHLNKIQIRT